MDRVRDDDRATPRAGVGRGRLLGWLLSLYGLAIFGYLTATLTSHFIERDRSTARGPSADPAAPATDAGGAPPAS